MTGDQNLGNPGMGRPMVDMESPFNVGNPYEPPGTAGDSRTQVGFTTFGPIHLPGERSPPGSGRHSLQ